MSRLIVPRPKSCPKWMQDYGNNGQPDLFLPPHKPYVTYGVFDSLAGRPGAAGRRLLSGRGAAHGVLFLPVDPGGPFSVYIVVVMFQHRFTATKRQGVPANMYIHCSICVPARARVLQHLVSLASASQTLRSRRRRRRWIRRLRLATIVSRPTAPLPLPRQWRAAIPASATAAGGGRPAARLALPCVESVHCRAPRAKCM